MRYILDVDEFDWQLRREDFSFQEYDSNPDYEKNYREIDLGFLLAVVDQEGYVVALEDYGIPDREWLLDLWRKNAPHPNQKFPLKDGRELTYEELLDEIERLWKLAWRAV